MPDISNKITGLKLMKLFSHELIGPDVEQPKVMDTTEN